MTKRTFLNFNFKMKVILFIINIIINLYICINLTPSLSFFMYSRVFQYKNVKIPEKNMSQKKIETLPTMDGGRIESRFNDISPIINLINHVNSIKLST